VADVPVIPEATTFPGDAQSAWVHDTSLLFLFLSDKQDAFAWV
jgi:hypothetical protein